MSWPRAWASAWRRRSARVRPHGGRAGRAATERRPHRRIGGQRLPGRAGIFPPNPPVEAGTFGGAFVRMDGFGTVRWTVTADVLGTRTSGGPALRGNAPRFRRAARRDGGSRRASAPSRRCRRRSSDSAACYTVRGFEYGFRSSRLLGHPARRHTVRRTDPSGVLSRCRPGGAAGRSLSDGARGRRCRSLVAARLDPVRFQRADRARYRRQSAVRPSHTRRPMRAAAAASALALSACLPGGDRLEASWTGADTGARSGPPWPGGARPGGTSRSGRCRGHRRRRRHLPGRYAARRPIQADRATGRFRAAGGERGAALVTRRRSRASEATEAPWYCGGNPTATSPANSRRADVSSAAFSRGSISAASSAI